MFDEKMQVEQQKLNHLLLIDHEFELKTQRLRCLTAKKHPIHKYLKEVHHRAELGIYRQLKLHNCIGFVNSQL